MTYLLSALLIIVPWYWMPVLDWARAPKEFIIQVVLIAIVMYSIARGRTRVTSSNLPLALLMMWLFLSIAKIGFLEVGIAPVLHSGMEAAVSETFYNANAVNLLLFGMFYFILQSSEIDKNFVVGAMIVSTYLIAVHGLSQYWHELMPMIPKSPTWRVSGVFGNPNDYSQHLAMCLPLFLLMKHKSKWVFMGLTFVAILMAKLLTERSIGAGLIALPFGLAFYVLATQKHAGKIIIGMCVIVMCLYPVCEKKGFASLGNRLHFIDQLGEAQAKSPLSKVYGWGFGNYKQHMAKIIESPDEPVLTFAHNEMLQFYTEAGYIGLVLILLLLANTVRIVYKNIKDHETVVYTTVLIITFVISIFSFPLHIPSSFLVFWIIYAFLMRRDAECCSNLSQTIERRTPLSEEIKNTLSTLSARLKTRTT